MKTMRRAALVCLSAVAVHSGTSLVEEGPGPCTEQVLGSDSKACCVDQDAITAAGDSGNCGFDCLDRYQLNADGDDCDPRPCPSETSVANAFATGMDMITDVCGWECMDNYKINELKDACEPARCETDVENATATGTDVVTGDCGFACDTNYEKSSDGLSCVKTVCPQVVANAESTGFLIDGDCDFECNEDYQKNAGGDGCEPKPCTTTVENAVAIGTNEVVDDCGYTCKEGFAIHKTNGLCEAKSAGEMTTKEVSDAPEESDGGAKEPAEKSPAAKMITSVLWLAVLGAPFWQ